MLYSDGTVKIFNKSSITVFTQRDSKAHSLCSSRYLQVKEHCLDKVLMKLDIELGDLNFLHIFSVLYSQSKPIS